MRLKDILVEEDSTIKQIADRIFEVLTIGIEFEERRKTRGVTQGKVPIYKFSFKKFLSIIGLLDDLKLPINIKSEQLDKLSNSPKIKRALSYFNSLIGQDADKVTVDKVRQVIADIAPDIVLYASHIK